MVDSTKNLELPWRRYKKSWLVLRLGHQNPLAVGRSWGIRFMRPHWSLAAHRLSESLPEFLTLLPIDSGHDQLHRWPIYFGPLLEVGWMSFLPMELWVSALALAFLYLLIAYV